MNAVSEDTAKEIIRLAGLCSDDCLVVSSSSHVVQSLTKMLGDSHWTSKQARLTGLARLAVAQIGTLNSLNETEFTKRVAAMVKKTVTGNAAYAQKSASASSDMAICMFADNVVEILKDLQAHGTKWLYLLDN